jgi:hypothetical protein
MASKNEFFRNFNGKTVHMAKTFLCSLFTKVKRTFLKSVIHRRDHKHFLRTKRSKMKKPLNISEKELSFWCAYKSLC